MEVEKGVGEGASCPLPPSGVGPDRPLRDGLLGLAGGALGSAIGTWLFFLLLTRQGLYAIVLPAALMGLGCGALSGRRSLPLGLACAAAGTVLTLVVHWRSGLVPAETGFGDFLSGLGTLSTGEAVRMAIGVFMAFWFGVGRKGGAWFGRRCGKNAAERTTTNET